MKTYNINLNSLYNVRTYISRVSRIPEEVKIDLVSGKNIVDGRSLIAVFSLNLNQPVQCVVRTSDEEVLTLFEGLLDEYIIKSKSDSE